MTQRSRKSRTTKICTPDCMEAFNLLECPIWIFDIEEKTMIWANDGALELWNADSLESLLNRSYADDMSESTERRLNEYMVRFRKGETVHDQWTLYPNGRATTLHMALSGILVESRTGPRLCMLNEGSLANSEHGDPESLRGVEMLRHIPVAVCQFDLEGNLMSQNPKSLELFGSPAEDATHSLCSYHSRFVDQDLCRHALEAVHAEKHYSIEAQQQTKSGCRWFSISLSLSKDPVTSHPVLLYSARDTTEVIEAKEEAERANHKKTHFLAVMAHELRTPLHQVLGFIELLFQTAMTQQQMEYAAPMQSASISLMSVINDLLDYTKIDAGKFQLERISFDVNDVLKCCQEIMDAKATIKGLTLKCHLQDELRQTKVIGDPNRLRQILLNILGNAVKFTPRDGHIHVSVTSEEGNGEETYSQQPKIRLRFLVEDTGIGISAQDQNQIFEKYQQANASIARQYGGTGLGLSICKSLVENMGGSIAIESILGVGTKIMFDIPFEIPSQSTDELPAQTALEESTIEPLEVLVAEDNGINQKVITAMLQRMGHTVTLADTGIMAVQLIEAAPSKFDAILMDVQMPEMDGIEATRLLRKKGYQLAIIGLTASYQPSGHNLYKDAGMDDCIGKPAQFRTVCRVLREVVKAIRERTRECDTPKEEKTSMLEATPCSPTMRSTSEVEKGEQVEGIQVASENEPKRSFRATEGDVAEQISPVSKRFKVAIPA